MTKWRLVLRLSSTADATQDTRTLKQQIGVFMRVAQTHETEFLGIRLLGVDFIAEDHEFNHIMRLLKILEGRRRFSIMLFDELHDGVGQETQVTTDTKSATRVA